MEFEPFLGRFYIRDVSEREGPVWSGLPFVKGRSFVILGPCHLSEEVKVERIGIIKGLETNSRVPSSKKMTP